MASEDLGEKTEEATPWRLRRARDQGEVGQQLSKDLSSALVLAVALVTLLQGAGSLMAIFTDIASLSISAASLPDTAGAFLINRIRTAFIDGVSAILPLLAAAVGTALVVGYFQIGPVLSFEVLKPDPKRLDPAAGFRRIFLSSRSWVALLKALLIIVVGFGLAWSAAAERVPAVWNVWRDNLPAAAESAGQASKAVAIPLLLLFLAFGVFDAALLRIRFKKNLRMSRREVRKEYEDQDGKPENKAARKRFFEEILQEQMFSSLLKARNGGFVAANPVHLACAVGFDEATSCFRLLAKGKGVVAERIKAAAAAERIPVRHDVPLARALFRVEINEAIPAELTQAMAVVLLWVEDLLAERGEVPSWRAALFPSADPA